jgi:hypothetical protein
LEKTGVSHDDPAGQRPSGSAEKGTEEADYAAAGGAELRITPRQVRRMLRQMKKKGDKAVIHKLRRQPSKRKTEEKTREKIVRIFSGEVYRGFGPTLASEYLRLSVSESRYWVLWPAVSQMQCVCRKRFDIPGNWQWVAFTIRGPAHSSE